MNLLAECMYRDEQRIRLEYERYKNDQTKILLGRIENELLVGIIGFVWLSESEVELKHIAVKPSDRNRGLGKEMIHELIEENYIKRLVVETDKEAVNFYEKNGFHITSLGEKYPGVERFKCIRDCD